MDLSLQAGAIGWLVSLLANTIRILRRDDLEREKMRMARAAADEANRAKSKFLADMSHELRLPLTAILACSEGMKREIHGPLQPRYRDYAAGIFESGNHLLGLINEILDLSKLEAGRFELHDEEFELAEAVCAAMRVIEPQAEACKVQLIDAIARDLPRMRGDSRRMRQVLINLLSNAVKFTRQGGKVRVWTASRAEGLILHVRDTGIGIPPEQIAKVLEPFFQIENTLSRKHEGSGLGLPIAKRLVELHGGTLAIDSRVGAGTTVTILIPRSRLLGPETRGQIRISAPVIPGEQPARSAGAR